MIKLYSFTLAGALLAVTSAFAAQPQAEKATVSDAPAQKVALTPVLQKSKIAKAPAKAEEEGTWTKKSTGIWFEGPFATRFSDVDEGQWDVDILENEAKPGWIRLNPYTEGTQLAELTGEANDKYLEINIENPEKCYFLDWEPYGYTYCSYCTENGFGTAAYYGTLEDGVITFASGTVAYYNSEWAIYHGEIKIVLDKDTYVDYTVTAEAPFCCTADDQYFTFTKSDAIATVKVGAFNGYYIMDEDYADYINNNGIDVTAYAGKKIGFRLTAERDPYSVLYVGLDADGNIKAQGAIYTYVLDDEKDSWTELGDATYTEGVLCLLFSDVDSEDLTCKVEENKEKPGYFRLVNAYAGHSMGFSADCAHNHYIYINATDPDHVYVEPSMTGAYVTGFGHFACESWGNLYLDDIEQGETNGVWGKYDKEEGLITVPQFILHVSDFSNASKLNFYNAEAPSSFAVKLPNISGISDIVTDDAKVAPVYYNLQGVRIAEPQNGLFIEVRGNKATKVIK